MSYISRVPTRRAVRNAYDLWSRFYDAIAAPSESGARMQALRAIRIDAGDRLLDVGVGSGAFFAEIVRKAGPDGFACGIDLSAGMLSRARDRLLKKGLSPRRLLDGDALALPFRSESFDLVVSSYVLDLLPIDEIFEVLTEFRRVLRPGGRTLLVNLTKIDPERRTLYERCYEALPPIAKAYIFGGCRPVCLSDVVGAAGFVGTRKTLVRQALSSEILVAKKPAKMHRTRRAA